MVKASSTRIRARGAHTAARSRGVLRRLRSRLGDERGMAMVLSLMVSFVVLLISTTVVAQSVSTLGSSGYDRRRTLAIHGSEAGLDQLYRYLAFTTPANLTTGPFTVDVATKPSPTDVSVTVRYLNAAGGTILPPFNDTTYPAGVLVHSVAKNGAGVARTMESYLTLTPQYAGFDQAIMSANSATFSNNMTVNGLNGDDADIVVLSGNLVISNSAAVHGTLYVPTGTATVSGNSTVYGSIWANGSVVTSNPNTVTHDVTSSTASVVVGGHVQGDVRAGTTVTGASNVTGSVLANAPQGPPPSKTFPTIGYDQSSWIAAGYTNFQTFTDCTAARNYVEGSWTGNTVVRITGSCMYNNGNNATVNLNGSLAIITDGGITFGQKSTWNGISSMRKLYLISTAPTASCTGSKDITLGNNTDFNALTQVLFYTPCSVTMSNSNAFSGQVLGGTVTVGNQFAMNYRPVLVPGSSNISGFDENIAYVREVV